MAEEGAVAVEVRDGVVVARVSGDIDVTNVDGFATALRAHLGHATRAMLVDLSGARYLDSSGLRALFEAAATLMGDGRHLTFVVPPGHPLRRLLEISGAEGIGRFADSVDDALASPGA